MTALKPSWEQDLCYSGDEDRQLLAAIACVEGVSDLSSSLIVDTTGAVGPSVEVGPGAAWVEGDTVDLQGMYYIRNDNTPIQVDLDAADGSNPRVDLIYAQLWDNQHDSSGNNDWEPLVAAGTPTAGANLTNLTGAGTLPDSAIPLAYVLVPAGGGTAAIVDTNILSARTQAVFCGDRAVWYSRKLATADVAVANNTATAIVAHQSSEGSATNNERWTYAAGIYTVKEAGVYQMSSYAHWQENSTGRRYSTIRLNGVDQIPNDAMAASNSVTIQTTTAARYLAAGTTVQMAVAQESGGSLDLLESALSLMWIGPLVP